jgi:hypothetical protein
MKMSENYDVISLLRKSSVLLINSLEARNAIYIKIKFL